jgi:hypothetical protein
MKSELLDDGCFLLTAMSGQTITLTARELGQLAKLAENNRDRLPLESARAPSLVTTPISKVVVSVDSHHTQVILRLTHRGYEAAYGLTQEVAEGIVDGVTRQLALIQESKRGQIKQ